ncbi:unnamed protein product [Caenorhabditis brenneri]
MLFILFGFISELGRKTKELLENTPEHPIQNLGVDVPEPAVQPVQHDPIARPPPRHILPEDAVDRIIAHNLRRDIEQLGLY